MAKRKRISKSMTSDGYYAYLTKRVLVSSAKSAGKVAAKKAMDLMGYVITVKDVWLVRENQDGSFEQMEKLQTA